MYKCNYGNNNKKKKYAFIDYREAPIPCVDR